MGLSTIFLGERFGCMVTICTIFEATFFNKYFGVTVRSHQITPKHKELSIARELLMSDMCIL
jgi:hypothetical protein